MKASFRLVVGTQLLTAVLNDHLYSVEYTVITALPSQYLLTGDVKKEKVRSLQVWCTSSRMACSTPSHSDGWSMVCNPSHKPLRLQ